MFRTLLAIVLALYIPLSSGVVAQTLTLNLIQGETLPEELALNRNGSGLVNMVEEAKGDALFIENFLEMAKGRVENSFNRGDITQEQWEEYEFLHEDAVHFHHLLVMAVLFYEEAPDDMHAMLLSMFSRDLAERVLRLKWFCENNGIDVTPLGELII